MIVQSIQRSQGAAAKSEVNSVAASYVGQIDEAPEAIKVPLKVLVVDDELAGMDRGHLSQLEPSVDALLGDSQSPEVEEILSIAAHAMDVSAIYGNDTKTSAFLASNEFVSNVLLTPTFLTMASGGLQKSFTNFFSKYEKVQELRKEFEAAFPRPDYELVFRAERPQISNALSFDLVVLDLVLKGSANAVDELVNYLKDLAETAKDEKIPPIIVMSTHPALRDHRRTFSERACISAAGLWILPKSDLGAPDFKARGLRLAFEQLSRQKLASHNMRIFVKRWTNALDLARESAATTLWNLDASAMQRIHHTAIKDNDPYDDHLGELIAREYLWHVESNKSVSDAVRKLDECFRNEIDVRAPDKLQYRFMAPLVDPDVTRGFYSHFTWLGWPSTDTFFGDTVKDTLGEFNTRVPFGTVLASELVDGGECLIHITQQCDLNAATKPKPEQRSSVFATALVHEAYPHRLTTFHSQDLVARGLMSGGKEFDLKFVQGRTVAMSIPDFLKKAEAEKLKSYGRLRFDVANHFVQATANQLTRPASFVMAREGSFEAKLFLIGEKIPKGNVVYLDDNNKGRVVRVVRDGQLLSFQDDDSVRIAIWLERQMQANYAAGAINLAELSNTLRLGQKIKEQVVTGVRLDIFYGNIDRAFQILGGIKAEEGKVIMALIADESTKPLDQR